MKYFFFRWSFQINGNELSWHIVSQFVDQMLGKIKESGDVGVLQAVSSLKLCLETERHIISKVSDHSGAIRTYDRVIDRPINENIGQCQGTSDIESATSKIFIHTLLEDVRMFMVFIPQQINPYL